MMVNYSPQPPPRSPWVRFMLEYNPFYLLSAMCMLAGLFSLNDSLDWSPLPMFNVLMLIVMLNLYELLLIGFGIYLHNRGLKRDATTLLVLEAFFLVDAGFLNSEVFTQSLEVGVIVNLILLVLACVKLSAIFRALGLPLRGNGVFALVIVQLGVLFTMPGICKGAAGRGSLSPIVLYALWWGVGALIAMAAILLRGGGSFTQGPHFYRLRQNRILVAGLLGLGFVSILAHLCTSNFVYGVPWYSANVAPLLLGLAVAATSVRQTGLSMVLRMRVLVSLPALAMLLSAAYPAALEFQPGGLLIFSPLRIVLIASAFLYLHAMCAQRQPLFGAAFGACLITAGMGHSVPQIGMNVDSIAQFLADAFSSLMPQSTVHWGVVAVVVAFLLLLLGVLLSLLKGRLEDAALDRYLDEQARSLGSEHATRWLPE